MSGSDALNTFRMLYAVEPADWDLPARETLAGALLMTGDHPEAERVFRAEIAKHQRNGRALFGLVESLKRQGKDSSALMVQREFETAWETADTKLTPGASIGDEYQSRADL